MSKQLTPLEALKQVRTFRLSYSNGDWLDKEEQDKLFDIIETALKRYEEVKRSYGELQDVIACINCEHRPKLLALEIIKEKQVNMYYLLSVDTVEDYNEIIDMKYATYENFHLTQEEFNLLKEVLE